MVIFSHLEYGRLGKIMWKPKEAVLQAQAALRHKDVLGPVQCRLEGFGQSVYSGYGEKHQLV